MRSDRSDESSEYLHTELASGSARGSGRASQHTSGEASSDLEEDARLPRGSKDPVQASGTRKFH